jgi:ABC-type glutathione transport system ATPase component
MVTHDPVAAAYADRVLLLADGRVAGTLERARVSSALAARLAACPESGRRSATCRCPPSSAAGPL